MLMLVVVVVVVVVVPARLPFMNDGMRVSTRW